MTTGKIANKAYLAKLKEHNTNTAEQGWQAAADAVTAHEREAVVREMDKAIGEQAAFPALAAVLRFLRDRFAAGSHHFPSPKTPGQVAWEAFNASHKIGTEMWDGIAQAVLDHAKGDKYTEVLDCGCTVTKGWRCPVHSHP